MAANWATFPATGAGWASAKHAFLGVFIEDPDARETILATFHDNSTFVEQAQTSVAAHKRSSWCVWVTTAKRNNTVRMLEIIIVPI